MMRLGKLLGAVGAAALIGCAAPAMAQDATDKLLLRLKKKGILTSDEYDALVARKSTQASVPAATGAPTVNAAVAQGEATQQAAAERLDDDEKMVRMTDCRVGLQIGDVAPRQWRPGDPVQCRRWRSRHRCNSSSAIRNGLLPGFLKVDVTSNQGGWDVGAHFGLYPGINSNLGNAGANGAGSPAALQTSGIDARQTYLTFGRSNFGEIKIGRDIGLFGSDAILNDITLLAVGTAAGNGAPSDTSLGRIGLGYIYTDFQPQITYSSPKFGGLQMSGGIFQPLTTVGFSEVNGTPGFQGKVTYDMVPTDGGLGLHAWVSGLVQKHDATGTLPAYTGRAVDLGAKLPYANASLIGNYYTGTGVGTIGLFPLSTDALGRKRDNDGL